MMLKGDQNSEGFLEVKYPRDYLESGFKKVTRLPSKEAIDIEARVKFDALLSSFEIKVTETTESTQVGLQRPLLPENNDPYASTLIREFR